MVEARLAYRNTGVDQSDGLQFTLQGSCAIALFYVCDI